jgi:hypothetical protein
LESGLESEGFLFYEYMKNNKYRITYKNEQFHIEKRTYFWFWKPLTRIIHREQVDLIFGNMYSLEEYLKDLTQEHIQEQENFSILFL